MTVLIVIPRAIPITTGPVLIHGVMRARSMSAIPAVVATVLFDMATGIMATIPLARGTMVGFPTQPGTMDHLTGRSTEIPTGRFRTEPIRTLHPMPHIITALDSA